MNSMTANDVKTIAQELVSKLGLDLSVEVIQDDELFLVNLVGKDTRAFERGKDNKAGAFVTILKLLIKKVHGTEPRIVVDLNSQRAQRLQNVAAMARKMAEMVRVKGIEEELPPMTPAERRAVHMELKQMTGIKTTSRGEEPHRRIVIDIADEE
jgi:spoIIIJ-associated protein